LRECAASRIALEPSIKASVSVSASVTVSARYDIFRLDAEGPLWFAAVENLQEVKKQVDGVGCDCIVFDSLTGEKTVVKLGQDVMS
jgi:hypothetical protein